MLSIQNINLNVLFLLSFQSLFIVLAVVAVVYCYHRSAITIFIATSLPCMCVYVEEGCARVRARVCVYVCVICAYMSVHIYMYACVCIYSFYIFYLLICLYILF